MAKDQGKKNPIQKGDFIQKAREYKVDECCRRCFLHPERLAENVADKKQVHPHTPPMNLGPIEVAKEYTGQTGQ